METAAKKQSKSTWRMYRRRRDLLDFIFSEENLVSARAWSSARSLAFPIKKLRSAKRNKLKRNGNYMCLTDAGDFLHDISAGNRGLGMSAL